MYQQPSYTAILLSEQHDSRHIDRLQADVEEVLEGIHPSALRYLVAARKDIQLWTQLAYNVWTIGKYGVTPGQVRYLIIFNV